MKIVAKVVNLMLGFFNHSNWTSIAQVRIHFISGIVIAWAGDCLCLDFGLRIRGNLN